MLVTLSIRDIVLIDKLDLSFETGMTVLTGETGAGKSILLDSLSLALGGRGDAGLVRQGQERGQITAVFDVPLTHPARRIMAENDQDADGDIILRRVQAADGRTRAYLNDAPVSAGLLRRVGETLVEVHGQHDERALVDPQTHRRLIDSFGGLSEECAELGALYRAYSSAKRELSQLEKRIDEARREADYLRSSVDELSGLDPQAGEEQELALKRQDMMQVEKIASELIEAHETLDGGTSPIPELASLLRRLERKVEQVPALLSGVVEQLGTALDNLEEARAGLQLAVRASEFDQGELERVEERLFGLRAASRKFAVPVDELPKLRDNMAADLEDLDAGEDKLLALRQKLDETAAAYDRKALQLSQKRSNTARALEEAVHQELPALKLERARLIVDQQVDEGARGPEGIDTIEFHAQTNPGTRSGPMFKVASGGELSRFLLALKVSLADKGSAPTLVFDEIDTGVGGAVAEAIGLRLARLARQVQVLTVTHAPQVAARAGGHLLISKHAVSEEQVVTNVQEIFADTRLEEVARMLAGSKISDEARAAAAHLLEEAPVV
ncbi:DNA repair protein RecN [Polycladidibacter hongkongensis]|uniref:DNA repair protein RecN n=1 Tax=Polycladidibacter hongkongensis TaxID=1647556 RepID=UPI00083588E2|nr:DNA repair protein RecN [Pseudovibrio hongkongensis]